MKKSEAVFEISGLRVRYGFRTAVEEISLSATGGSGLALLGTNGSGKTSTLRTLMGLLRPTRGTVKVFGDRPGSHKALSRIGFAPESALAPEFLTGEQYLSFVASLKIKSFKSRKAAVKEMIRWSELEPRTRFQNYSRGMRRRLVLAQAFLGDPDLLILDEPLNGLDPLFIVKLRDRILAYRDAGGTVILSSHILSEVERVCSDIAILSQGRLVCAERLKDLQKQHGSLEAAFSKFVGGKSA